MRAGSAGLVIAWRLSVPTEWYLMKGMLSVNMAMFVMCDRTLFWKLDIHVPETKENPTARLLAYCNNWRDVLSTQRAVVVGRWNSGTRGHRLYILLAAAQLHCRTMPCNSLWQLSRKCAVIKWKVDCTVAGAGDIAVWQSILVIILLALKFP